MGRFFKWLLFFGWLRRNKDVEPEIIAPSPKEEIVALPEVELAPAPPPVPRFTGVVDWFSERRGFGIIRVRSSDPGMQLPEKIFVHITDVDGKTSLVAGESVEFEIEHSPDRISGKRVSRLDNRRKGRVAEWLDDKGYGFVETEDGKRAFVHNSQIASDGPSFLEPGEDVEFAIRETARGAEALRVQVFQSRYLLERFANVDRLRDGLIEELAGVAEKEIWEYGGDTERDGHGVLTNYIYYTLARVIEQGKIEEKTTASGEHIACANTGLVSPQYENIFAYFVPNRHHERPQKWFLQRFVKEGDRRLVDFDVLPEPATYWDDPAELIFDWRRDVRYDVKHIISDNNHRFPENLRSNALQLQHALEGATETAKKRARQNFKTAIPQFYRGKLQLLLPLAPSIPGLALVVERKGEVYLASTVLPFEFAYNNARLVARPDSDWLKPLPAANTGSSR
jgi:cold shock CspA family protein